MSADTEARAPAGAEIEPLPGFVTRAASMRHLASLARRAAERARSVLITGESGTGKGHLARAMHEAGRGAAAPFVIIDCANLPEALAENELFGHESGAFSGATSRQAGKFEVAHGGTVLLDRVSDIPKEVQGKLLRVLQERAFERVGGQATVEVDVVILATAPSRLEDLVRLGAFRRDLYYRLNVVHLEIPPLRERPDDIPLLVGLFLDKVAAKLGRRCRVTDAGLESLMVRSWPGNVRELQNLVEHAATMTEGVELGPAELSQPAASGPSPDRAVAELVECGLSLEELERLYIARVLRSVGGRVGRAADLLGIHRKTLLEKRRRYDLE